jgi:hypothetical protein
MKGDKLNCPNCRQEYTEEFAESNINKTFICKSCEMNIYINVTSKGYLSIQRDSKNKTYYKKRQFYEDDEYIFRKMKEYILLVRKEYNGIIFNLFLTNPQLWWVKKARAMLLEDLNMIGISRASLRLFFKIRGGNIGEMTITKYLKD